MEDERRCRADGARAGARGVDVRSAAAAAGRQFPAANLAC